VFCGTKCDLVGDDRDMKALAIVTNVHYQYFDHGPENQNVRNPNYTISFDKHLQNASSQSSQETQFGLLAIAKAELHTIFSFLAMPSHLRHRAVSRLEARTLAQAYNSPYFEVSAKTNQENVTEVFEEICRRVKKKQDALDSAKSKKSIFGFLNRRSKK